MVVTLLRHLDRSLFDLHLALLAGVGPYLKEVPEDVPIHDLKVFRVRRSPLAMIRLVRKLRPDIVLSTPRQVNVALGFVRSWLPRNVRILMREESSVAPELAEKSSCPRVWSWLYRHFYVKADTVICVSDYILNELAEDFAVPRNKMVRIYNPVDIDAVRKLAELGGSPYVGAGPHLVAAGRLTWQKGFDVLLDAMALVRKTLPGARLTILGDGPLQSELEDRRERLGLTDVVRFAGFQSNPFPYLKHANLFVHSARYEGLGNVILEALAVGTLVVATDSPGGVREILGGSSVGILVPHSDARLLAQGIVSACRGEAVARAEDFDKVLAQVRINRVLREYEALFAV